MLKHLLIIFLLLHCLTLVNGQWTEYTPLSMREDFLVTNERMLLGDVNRIYVVRLWETLRGKINTGTVESFGLNQIYNGSSVEGNKLVVWDIDQVDEISLVGSAGMSGGFGNLADVEIFSENIYAVLVNKSLRIKRPSDFYAFLPGDPGGMISMAKTKNRLYFLREYLAVLELYYVERSAPDTLQQTALTSPNVWEGKLYSSTEQLFLQTEDSLFVMIDTAWHACQINLPKLSSTQSVTIAGKDQEMYLTWNAKINWGNVSDSTKIYLSIDGGKSWQDRTSIISPNARYSEVADAEGQIFLLTLQGPSSKLYIHARGCCSSTVSHFNGTVFRDRNDNGLKDFNESTISGLNVYTNNEQFYSTTDQSGQFKLFSLLNTPDTIKVSTTTYQYLTTDLPVYAPNNTGPFEIGVNYPENIKDLCVALAVTPPLRPGFASQVTAVVKNVGTVPSTGTLRFFIPKICEFLGAQMTPFTQIADTVYIQLPILNPEQSVTYTFDIKTDVTTPLNTITSVTAEVVLADGTDYYIYNNRFTSRETVVGSFDPNDKMVSYEEISPTFVQNGDYLHYKVRFQNTGNYPATFVRIIDTISQHLDLKSIQVVAASHPYSYTLRGRNVLDVFFDNINLPDSTSNEPESHGFVLFSIRVDSTLQIGQSILNTAEIYFDYNEPVITNTVGSRVTVTGVKNLELQKPLFQIEPNPAANQTFVRFSELGSRPTQLKIFDMSGSLVFSKSLSPNEREAVLNLELLPSGAYKIVLFDAQNHQSAQILVISR